MSRLGAFAVVALAVLTASAWGADPSLSPTANTAFLATYAKKHGVVVRPSGLEYRILQSGFGTRPTNFDVVKVYYEGKLINGRRFDATEPGFPAEFPVNGVIPGWTEALELMREGDHWELVIPANLAYGSRGAGEAVPPNQTLVFDVQLLNVSPPPKDREKQDSDNGQ
ncbi:MAG TPA: FKBP-type peptidyl-prolyl cis-trans isomerase [Rhizomicrobium sp.]|nr:FKBP-type peptidyl-prolyl cis-trans isomerase [Rhizomicrobium sp.]